MPARKPQTLNKRHATKDEIADRAAAEAAMVPSTQLSRKPPPLLQKHKHAGATWDRLVSLYFETEHMFVTAFDTDLLAKYCLLEEECLWLEDLRSSVYKQAMSLQKKLEKINLRDVEQMKLYYSLSEQYNALIARVQGLDARLDGKRKLSHDYAKSMYLTPRSRVGVAPAEKPPAEADDGFGSKFD